MLNVQFVVLPCLKGLVEAPVTLHRVVHEDRASARRGKYV